VSYGTCTALNLDGFLLSSCCDELAEIFLVIRLLWYALKLWRERKTWLSVAAVVVVVLGVQGF